MIGPIKLYWEIRAFCFVGDNRMNVVAFQVYRYLHAITDIACDWTPFSVVKQTLCLCQFAQVTVPKSG